MSSADTSEKTQLPAVAPKLKAYVDSVVDCLQTWTRANGQNWEALTDPDALLLQTLLLTSMAEINLGKAPVFQRSCFKGVLGEELTRRRWEKFLRWFSRELEPSLIKLCSGLAQPVLYPGRSSVRGGGHPYKSQALYFLSFDRPSFLIAPSTEKAATRNATATVAGGSDDTGSSREANGGQAASDSGSPLSEGLTGTPAKGAEAVPRDEPAGKLDSRQTLPSSVRVNLWIPMADRACASVCWLAAIASVVAATTFVQPSDSSLTYEVARFANAIRDVLAGVITVRL